MDANNIRFLDGDVGVVGLGRAERQTGTPTLSGSYAFGSQGDTIGFLSSMNSAGRFTANGGAITAGARDAVQDGSSVVNVAFTGSYTQTGNGRAVLSLSTAANNNLIVWMVSPSRGFFVVNDPNTIQEGTLDLQQRNVLKFDDERAVRIRHGRIRQRRREGPGGNAAVGRFGKTILNEFTNAAGVPTGPIVLSGTYSVSGNGRATGTINTLSNNLIFYLISGTDGYVLQNDAGVQISGTISKQ